MPSILGHGILSNERAAQLPHKSVAMSEVQERRDKVKVPKGLRLHQYANRYFHARNPMMFKRKGMASKLCVLRIAKKAMQLSGAVIADQNASSNWVRFLAPSQIDQLNLTAVFATDWRDDYEPAYWRKKSQKCAELLIPHVLPVDFIEGAYVVNAKAQKDLESTGFELPISIDADLFFH